MREKRILEERQKREVMMEKLKQDSNNAHNQIANFFRKVDDDERLQKEEAEFKKFEQELANRKIKIAEEESLRESNEEKKRREKEYRLQRTIEIDAKKRDEKLAAKQRRRDEYVINAAQEKERKKMEYEQRKAESLAAYQKREEKRLQKKQMGILPTAKVDYDTSKIFVGSIKLEDIDSKQLGKEKANALREQRINELLRIFDRYGEVLKRKVCLNTKLGEEAHHCFITFKDASFAEQAIMQLKGHENRAEITEQIKEKLKSSKQNVLAAPHPNFYVRGVKKQKKTKIGNIATSQPPAPNIITPLRNKM